MNHKQVQHLSSLQLKDLHLAERQALGSVRKLGDKVRKQAVAAMLGDEHSVTSVVTKAFVKPLTQGLVYGHLLGQRRAYLNANARPKAIALGLYEETIKRYDELDPTYLAYITDKYESKAFQILEAASDSANTALRADLVQAFQRQDTITGLKKTLAESFERLGLTPSNSYQIENIVRTQTQLAFQSGKWRAENYDPDVADLLWGYTYYSVGDDRVRPEHAALDGTTLPKDHIFWRTHYPPNGWSCRCQAVPLYEKEKEVLPRTSEPNDPDFNYNPGEVFAGITEIDRAKVPVTKAPVPTKTPTAKVTAPVPTAPIPVPVPAQASVPVRALGAAENLTKAITHKATRQATLEAYQLAEAAGDVLPEVVEYNLKSKAAAMYSVSNDKVYIKKITPKAAALYEQQVARGFWVQSNPVLHELGHSWHSKVVGQAYDTIKNTVFSAVEQELIRTQVSRYAATNALELVAEVYAGHRTGIRFSTEVMALFKRATRGVEP